MWDLSKSSLSEWKKDLSLTGAGLGLKATSEQLELGLIVLSDKVQFAVAQSQPFLRCKQVIVTTIVMATGEARFRSWPETLQLMILGKEVQLAVVQNEPLLIPRTHFTHVSRTWSWENIGPRPFIPEWAKLGDEVQLTVAQGLPSPM
jgi:hypothetical protein